MGRSDVIWTHHLIKSSVERNSEAFEKYLATYMKSDWIFFQPRPRLKINIIFSDSNKRGDDDFEFSPSNFET